MPEDLAKDTRLQALAALHTMLANTEKVVTYFEVLHDSDEQLDLETQKLILVNANLIMQSQMDVIRGQCNIEMQLWDVVDQIRDKIQEYEASLSEE